jgi:hypothetical protein
MTVWIYVNTSSKQVGDPDTLRYLRMPSPRTPGLRKTGAVSHSDVGNVCVLRIDRSRVSISYETTKARHTTNNAFTISQTSNHPIIPT